MVATAKKRNIQGGTGKRGRSATTRGLLMGHVPQLAQRLTDAVSERLGRPAGALPQGAKLRRVVRL